MERCDCIFLYIFIYTHCLYGMSVHVSYIFQMFPCNAGEGNGTPSVQENKNRVCFDTVIQAYRDDCDRIFVCSQGGRAHQHLIYPLNTLHL